MVIRVSAVRFVAAPRRSRGQENGPQVLA